MAIAPALTIGLVRPSALRSMPATELKAKPVAFAPSFSRAASGPISSQTSANRNGFDTLMIENSCSVSPARINVAAGADDADAEQLARHAGQRRIDLRILAFGVGFEAGMRLFQHSLNLLHRRQMTGRDIRRIGWGVSRDLFLHRRALSLATNATAVAEKNVDGHILRRATKYRTGPASLCRTLCPSRKAVPQDSTRLLAETIFTSAQSAGHQGKPDNRYGFFPHAKGRLLTLARAGSSLSALTPVPFPPLSAPARQPAT